MSTWLGRTLVILAVLILLVIALAVYIIRPWVPILKLPPLDAASTTYHSYQPEASALGRELEALMPQWRQEHMAPSISLAIGHRGELVWAGAVGHADIEQKQPATPETVYRIGSVSKTILATAAAIAVNCNIIDPDRPIEHYRPDYPHSGKGATLRKLLSHQAGIRHYGMMWHPPFFEYYLNRNFDTVDQGLTLFVEDPLQYPPGERFAYSSYGFNLASGVLESATGENFLTYISEQVFTPLGMSHTAAEGVEPSPPTAQWYEVLKDYEGVRRAPATNASYKWAGGGFLSTPSDLVKLGNAWLGNTLFTEHTRRSFWTPQTLNNDEINPQSYALGWRVEHKVLENFGDERPDFFFTTAAQPAAARPFC